MPTKKLGLVIYKQYKKGKGKLKRKNKGTINYGNNFNNKSVPKKNIKYDKLWINDSDISDINGLANIIKKSENNRIRENLQTLQFLIVQ